MSYRPDPAAAGLRKMVLRFVVAVGVAVVFTTSAAFAGYTLTHEAGADDPMNTAIYRLDNGLAVYLTENHETPRFYAEIIVRAGSKHDPADATGLAHYLEHLLFKGNREMGTLNYAKERRYLKKITRLYEKHFNEQDPEKQKEIYAEINRVAQKAAEYAIPGEMDKLYNAMGGTHLNAHTWHEETVYKVGLPSNRLEQWAAIESSRFVKPVFRLFHTELETVYEEKNRTLDNKDRVASYAMAETLFKVHPYGQQPTIGTVEHLKRPSLVKIYDFYNTWYVPNNMAIAISGDIDTAEAIEVIDRFFSTWRPKTLPKPKTWNEPPIKSVERVTVTFPGEEYVELAWRTAPHGSEDEDALLVLDFILDNSVAGLININLNQKQAVRSAGAYHQFLNDFGTEHLSGVPKEGQTLADVEALLLAQIDLVKNGEFEDWIIPAIITDFKKTQKAQLESNQARVSLIRDSFLYFDDWTRTTSKIARLERVTKQDVARVANKYFGDNYVALNRIDAPHEIPAIEKPQIDAVEIDPSRQSNFARDVLAMTHEQIEPVFVDPKTDFKKIELDSGRTIYYAPNPLNDLFSFSINVDIGTRANNKIALATMLLDKSGTPRFSSEALQKEWYKLGTDFGIGAGDNETTISISGLDENFEASLRLLMDLLRSPRADAATLEELVNIVLVSRADAKNDPATLNRALTLYNRNGADSQFLTRLPGNKLKQLTVAELHAAIADLLGYKQTIVYTGSLPLETFRAILERHHPLAGELKDPPPYTFLKARAPAETEIYFLNKELAQAQVRIEFGDGEFSEENDTAIDLYNTYFSGSMSGIVFQELREARGLAYVAGARYITGSRARDENIMVGVIGCQADKTPEALAAFIELFDDMPVSEERFDEALDSLVNRYRTTKTGFRQVLGAVRAWERLGLEIDPRKGRYEHLLAANINEMLDFQQTHIKSRPKLVSIVGDRNRIDMETLAESGKIIEIDIDKIFVD